MSNSFFFRDFLDKKSLELVNVVGPRKGLCVSRKEANRLGVPNHYVLAVVTCEHLRQLGLIGLEFPLECNGHTTVLELKDMLFSFKL